MGPQPNSCGNLRRQSPRHSVPIELQWGHSQTAVETVLVLPENVQSGGFNGATAKQLWKPAVVALGRSDDLGFNGATAKQLWKHVRRPRQGRRRPSASMGPQPNSCGNCASASTADCTGSFNGATAKQLWKRIVLHPVLTKLSQLQWGHSQTAVETCWSRTSRPMVRVCFNGATAKQLWKHKAHNGNMEYLATASMGPQPNSCGNRADRKGCKAAHHASMGPQPNSCGNEL